MGLSLSTASLIKSIIQGNCKDENADILGPDETRQLREDVARLQVTFFSKINIVIINQQQK